MQASPKPGPGAPTVELVSDLQSLAGQFEAIKKDAEDLIRGLGPSQFNWRNEPGRWAIAQCLDHLNFTADFYQPIIARGIEYGRSQGKLSQGPYSYGWFGRWFIGTVEPPVKARFKAPKKFVPPADRNMDEVVAKFFVVQEEFLDLISRANGVELARVKVQFPATKLIRIGLGQSLQLMAAHERRHLWQARRVRDHADFPHE